MAKKDSPDVSIGKFDILATYACAEALRHDSPDDEAKQRGMVTAIMGAQARLGTRKEHHEEFQGQKEVGRLRQDGQFGMIGSTRFRRLLRGSRG
jgi:hypothetical protein